MMATCWWGSIAVRSGAPHDTPQWGWHCGFHPGMLPGQATQGIAENFEEARAGFERDWNVLLPQLEPTAFDEYRTFRAHKAEIRRTREAGEKLDSEIPSSMMTCVCGVRFDSWNPEESYPHRVHITEAHPAKGKTR